MALGKKSEEKSESKIVRGNMQRSFYAPFVKEEIVNQAYSTSPSFTPSINAPIQNVNRNSTTIQEDTSDTVDFVGMGKHERLEYLNRISSFVGNMTTTFIVNHQPIHGVLQGIDGNKVTIESSGKTIVVNENDINDVDFLNFKS